MRTALHGSRRARGLVIAAVLGTVAAGTMDGARRAMRAADPPPIYVTTTADGPPGLCEGPGARRECTLRDAIETAARRASGRTIVARFCGPNEPGPYCLSSNDPNYDAVRRVWRIPLVEPYGFDITGTHVTIDFSLDAPGWGSVADNAVEIATGAEPIDWVFGVDGYGHDLRGFNVTGAVRTAGIVLYNGATSVVVGHVALAAIDGDGIRIRDERSAGNAIQNVQCGWLGTAPADGIPPPSSAVSGACLEISRGAHENLIGGAQWHVDGELVTDVFANAAVGIRITGRGTRANSVRGSLVTHNGVGIQIRDEALENVVESNTIVGNDGNGVELTGASWFNHLNDNHIGVRHANRGGGAAPNGGWGIDIQAPVKRTLVEQSVIEGNGAGGVRITGRLAEQNSLLGNQITGHTGAAIAVEGGANAGLQPPALSVAGTRFVGRTCSRCDVQFFSDPADEAAAWAGSATADNSGNVIFMPSQPFRYRYLTAMATNSDGNSSALSAPLDTIPGAAATATAVTTPGATATAGGIAVRGRVWLPVGWRGVAEP